MGDDSFATLGAALEPVFGAAEVPFSGLFVTRETRREMLSPHRLLDGFGTFEWGTGAPPRSPSLPDRLGIAPAVQRLGPPRVHLRTPRREPAPTTPPPGWRPVRDALAPAGARSFGYQAATRTVTVTLPGRTLELTAGERAVYGGPQPILLNQAPRLIGGRMYVSPMDTALLTSAGRSFVIAGPPVQGVPRTARGTVPAMGTVPTVAVRQQGRVRQIQTGLTQDGPAWQTTLGPPGNSFLAIDSRMGVEWAQGSWQFLKGEGRAALSEVNPIDWYWGARGIVQTYGEHGFLEGTGLLARAFVDGINPFGKRDMYEAGQAFMGLTLLLSRGLLTVPPTRLPVLGPRISRRMGRIPYTFEALEPYGLGGPSTRVIGLTRMATGEVMINENLRAFEHLLPYEDIEQFGSAAIDGVAELRAVIAHERSHAVRTLAYPRRLRPLRARLLKRSSVLTYLEEAAAEGDALGWRAGLMYPIEDGDVRLYKLIPEALAVGALGLSGFYGRHGTGPRDERLEQETIIAEDGYAF